MPLNLVLIQDGLGPLQSCSQIILCPTFKTQPKLVPTVILQRVTGSKLASKVMPLLPRSKSWEELIVASLDNGVIMYTPEIPSAVPGHKTPVPETDGLNSLAHQAPLPLMSE